MRDAAVLSEYGNIRPLRRPNHAAFERRWKTSWKAELQASETNVSCVVVNISSRGAGLNVSDAPVEGSIISLTLEDCQPIEARIVWRKGNAAGVCFVERQQWVVEVVAVSAQA